MNIENTRKSIEIVKWEAMFINKSFHEQANISTFDEKEPSWMKELLERKIKWENETCTI